LNLTLELGILGLEVFVLVVGITKSLNRQELSPGNLVCLFSELIHGAFFLRGIIPQNDETLTERFPLPLKKITFLFKLH
jgi:hypothetical protein